MCGTTVISTGREHAPQTPTEALATLPTTNPIRFFWQSGDHNGGAGSTVKGNACRDPATLNTPQNQTWFNALPDNSGAASAVCLLTAQVHLLPHSLTRNRAHAHSHPHSLTPSHTHAARHHTRTHTFTLAQ